ncbi:MAG: protein phosphatase 2C domain-containing protein [Methanospirillaceae archaeon]|nr:protein phosphatase 2C domain-containing protein [Methanospirillaceae archaeon]
MKQECTHNGKTVRIYGSCVQGASHEREGKECEDSWIGEVLPDTESLRALIAVSDGLGSAMYAKLGSSIAVSSALSHLEANRGAVFEAACHARSELFRVAEDLGISPRDLACTLIVADVTPKKASVAHIGDGIVIGKEGDTGEYLLISGPGPSEYVNEVIPLTADDSIDSIRCTEVMGISVLAVATDGCQGALSTRKDGGLEIFYPFVAPLFTYFTRTPFPDTGSSDLDTLLSGEKVKMVSDDDKTLVIAVISEEADDRVPAA